VSVEANRGNTENFGNEGRRRRMKIIGKILLGIVGVIAALYLIVFITAWL
jgi:hypothetical protein